MKEFLKYYWDTIILSLLIIALWILVYVVISQPNEKEKLEKEYIKLKIEKLQKELK